jgi:hypothetical protein
MTTLHSPTEAMLKSRWHKASSLLGLGAALSMGLTVPSAASAVTLADNLSETTGGGVVVGYLNVGTSDTTLQGMKFNTTSASIINSVSVKLFNGSSNRTTAGRVYFDIFTSISDLPGSLVGTVGDLDVATIDSTPNPTNASLSGTVYTFGSLALALNPNTPYFLIARPVGFDAGKDMTWRYTTSDNGFDYTPPVRVRSTNSGTSYTALSTDRLQLQIQASVATAPGPLPLLGGAAAFGWSRRMRQRLRTARKAANRCGHGA